MCTRTYSAFQARCSLLSHRLETSSVFSVTAVNGRPLNSEWKFLVVNTKLKMGMKVCKKRWSDPIRTWWLPTTHLAIPFGIWCVTSYGIYWIKLTTILFLLMSGFGFWRLPHFLAITTNKIPPADDRIWLMYHIDRVPISHSIIDLINSLLEGKNYRQWLIVTACHSQSSVAQVSFCIWVGASFQSSPRVCSATFSGRILSVVSASLARVSHWVEALLVSPHVMTVPWPLPCLSLHLSLSSASH